MSTLRISTLDGGAELGALDFEVRTFAGGEPHANVHNRDSISGRPFLLDARIASFNTVGEMLVVNDALRRSGASHVVAAIPYLPGARQDRSERGGPLTAKVYADIINAAGFDQVICVDPHSPVMPALLDNVTILNASETIDPGFLKPSEAGEDVVLICPDAGAAKRVEAIADTHKLEVVYARKHRDPLTGTLSHFSCDAIPDDCMAVVIDDICDGGGTFLGLAEAIDRSRIAMRLWTTHGIYSKGVSVLLDRFHRIGCTDSFPSLASGNPDVHTIRPIADLLFETATTTLARLAR